MHFYGVETWTLADILTKSKERRGKAKLPTSDFMVPLGNLLVDNFMHILPAYIKKQFADSILNLKLN